MSAKKRLKEEDILAVHKALSEAKVPTEDRYVGFFIPDGYMTGSEWLERFERNLQAIQPDFLLTDRAGDVVREAAKRASSGEK